MSGIQYTTAFHTSRHVSTGEIQCDHCNKGNNEQEEAHVTAWCSDVTCAQRLGVRLCCCYVLISRDISCCIFGTTSSRRLRHPKEVAVCGDQSL